jgi:acylphosphatase
MLKHLNIRVFGRVRDVGYRATARQKAIALGLVGLARNETDDSVYLEIEGEAGKIDKFLKWCYKGPWFAKVIKVEVTEGVIKHYINFIIDYNQTLLT